MAKLSRLTSIFLTATAIFAMGACRPRTGDAPEGLVVVNAPASGKVIRVLVSEGGSVQEKTSIIEIAVAPASAPTINENRRVPETTTDPLAEMRAAEDELQRASVELQRIEPLVASGGAPQSHLDAARAQYQQAQERVDQLRRRTSASTPNLNGGNRNANIGGAPRENVVPVMVPTTGNVRVISVRVGQQVRAGDPVATISTK